MSEVLIEEKEVKPEIVFSLRRPYNLIKGESVGYYIQDNRIYNMSGTLVISSETPKDRVLEFQRSELGATVLEAAGMKLGIEEVAEVQNIVKTYKCDVCGRQFSNPVSLGRHRSITHRLKKGEEFVPING